MTQPPTNARSTSYLAKLQRRLAAEATRTLFRRRLSVTTSIPLISFTFDDFPRSALFEAGSILMRYGALGTYYASLGLMGKASPVGSIYEVEDLKELVSQGHELGCHTFSHAHSWNTPPDEYERSILENQQALNAVLPGASFQSFAYPYSAPRLAVKRIAGKYFECCRAGGLKAGRYLHRHSAGGQTFNSGTIDLNCLCAFFLEKSRDDPKAVKTLIDQNARARGWLVFATHDVCANAGPFGCSPDFFERVVQWSVESGARILPVVKALEVVKSSQPM